jgi:hypothetical protein
MKYYYLIDMDEKRQKKSHILFSKIKTLSGKYEMEISRPSLCYEVGNEYFLADSSGLRVVRNTTFPTEKKYWR